MAVDGNLVFNTKNDTEGFNKGTKNLSSKMIDIKNKISSTEAAVKNLQRELKRTANTKVKTKVAEGLEKDLVKAKERLNDYFTEADRIGDAKQKELKDLGFSDEYLDKALEQDKAWQQIQEIIAKAELQVERYTKALQQANEAAPLAKDTAEFQKKQQRLDSLSGELDVYRAKLREAEQQERSQSSATSTAANRLSAAKQHLERTFKALKLFANGAAKAGRALKSAFSKTAGKLVSNLAGHFKRANNSTNVLEKSLRRIKNTLVRMFFFRLVHSPIDAVKDGLGEIAKISPEVNKNLSALKTESTYLENSLASLAAPLVNLLTPAFIGFMQTLSGVTDKAAQLVAALTGQKYTRAIKIQQDYAASLDDSTKAAKDNQKALAGFDELNVLEQSDSTETETAAPMFENVDAQVNSLSGGLLNALKNHDFKAVGQMFADKVNGALKKIKWDKIKNTVKSWAKNVAEFLNGFIEKTDWELVGKTIANGIGTAILFTLTLIKNFDFKNFGNALGDLINGLMSPENAANLAEAASSLLKGIFDALTTAIKRIRWSQVSKTIIAFITDFKLSDVAESATNLINSLAGAITQSDFKSIGDALREKIANIDWKGLWDGAVNLFTSAFQGLGDLFGFDFDTTKFKKALQDIAKPLSGLFGTLKESFGKLLTPIVNNLLPAVVGLIGNIAEAISPIISALTPFLSTVIDTVTRIFNALGPVLPVLGKALGNLVSMVIPILEPFLSSVATLVEALAPALDGIFTILGEIFSMLTPYFKIIQKVLNPIIQAIGGITKTLSGVIEFISGIFTGDWKKAWNGIKNIFSGIWEAITGIVKGVWESIKSIFTSAWEAIKNVWQGVVNYFKSIWDGITNVFKGVGGWFKGIFDGAVSGIKNAWNGVKQWFQNLWNGIWTVIKTPINWIIGGINAIIGGLNTLHIDIPDWVPIVGGQKWGFNIPEIPKLATGTVVPANYGEFLAVLGDNKREAEVVSPVSAMKQAFLEALAEGNFSGGDDEKEINLYIGEEKFFTWIIKMNNRWQKSHGTPAFGGGGA